jgi:hypothetical protein
MACPAPEGTERGHDANGLTILAHAGGDGSGRGLSRSALEAGRPNSAADVGPGGTARNAARTGSGRVAVSPGWSDKTAHSNDRFRPGADVPTFNRLQDLDRILKQKATNGLL